MRAALFSGSLDVLEARFARIQPLATTARFTLRFFATFFALGSAALLLGLVIYVVLRSVDDPHAHGFSIFLAGKAGFLVGTLFGGSYSILLNLIGRLSKLAAILWMVFAIVILCMTVPALLSQTLYIVDRMEILGLSMTMQVALAACALAFLIYYILVVPVSMIGGAVAAYGAAPEERNILKETPSGHRFPANVMSQLFGLPPLTNFARGSKSRYARIIALSTLSSFFMACATIAITAAPCLLLGGYAVTLRSDSPIAFGLVGIPIGLVAMLILPLLIGRQFERAELQLVRFSLGELQKADPRAPVLFLRAFADDQVELGRPAQPHLGLAMELGRRKQNLDELLLEEATPYGPLVALGSPTDAEPPYGAARGYFEDKSWKEAVEDLARISSVVVLCVDSTEGIWWEAEHLAATRQSAKTLFLIHPSHRSAAANSALMAQLASKVHMDPGWLEQLALEPTRPGKSDAILAFFLDGAGRPQFLKSSTFSRFAYLLAIRLFIRARLGMPSEPAKSAR